MRMKVTEFHQGTGDPGQSVKPPELNEQLSQDDAEGEERNHREQKPPGRQKRIFEYGR